MKTTLQRLAIFAAGLTVLGLSACGRDESQTVGQGVDKAIAEAKTQGEAAKSATQDATQKLATGAADAAITAKVNAALLADDGLKVMKVDVDTQNGRVTLSGAAPDSAARDRATALARATEGVSDVDNRLQVTPKS
jgi:hyperosmotically inducible periplasmic protein